VLGAAIALKTVGSNATTGAHSANRAVGLSLASKLDGRTVALTAAATAMVGAYGSLWVASPTTESVSRVDLTKRGIADSIPIDGGSDLLVAGAGSVWVAGARGDRVQRVDPASGEIVQTLRLGRARAAALGFGAGRLWVADDVANALIAFDPDTGRADRTLPLSLRPSSLAVGDGRVWVADRQKLRGHLRTANMTRAATCA
jgi:sugar lactone lactonase YvrE